MPILLTKTGSLRKIIYYSCKNAYNPYEGGVLMLLKVCFYAALAVLTGTFAWAIMLLRRRNMCRRVLTPMNVLFAGVLIASTILYLPIYSSWQGGDTLQTQGTDPLQNVNSLLLSLYSAICCFVVNGDYSIIFEYVKSDPLAPFYISLTLVLMVLAPVMTFGFVISFFKNLSAYAGFLCCYFKDVYVFTDLNERSLALARDLKQKHPKIGIIFTDIFCANDDEIFELQQGAKNLGAISFRKDVAAINFRLHSQKYQLWFFSISDDESNNLSHALQLAELYKDVPNSHLFVFTTSAESEVILASVQNREDRGDESDESDKEMKIRRVNPIRSLITHTLYDEGIELFRQARPMENGDKLISAVIVGLGEYGTNMVQSLAWFCQMDGYHVQIDAFDQDPLAEDRFLGLCPELMDEAHNGISIPGEAEYRIRIHAGLNTETKSFADQIMTLTETTYVLVALGSDEENLKMALRLRMLFERMKIKPVIQAIVYDSNKKKALIGRHNFRNQPYDIAYIGDLESSYTEDVIIDSEIEKEALQRHMEYKKAWEFWGYEYNYRSSIALAVHAKMRRLCQIPGAGKKEKELTDEERHTIEVLEHRRWNAYMRSEGYIYSGSHDPASRNDLAKMHFDMVPFAALSEEEKRKDSIVGSQ